MDQATATREILWNISHVWVMYLLFVIALGIAVYGFYQRLAVWKKGQPLDRFDQPLERLKKVLTHAGAQQRTIREKYAAVFHSFIYTGFIILTIATTVV